jgi:hypothetical protein
MSFQKYVIMKTNMKRLLFLFAIVSMLTGCVAKQIETAKPENNTGETATLRGSIWEDETGEPVVYGNVILLDGKDEMRYGTSINEKGEYQIEGVSYGKYTVRFVALGYYEKAILIDIKKNEEQLSTGLKYNHIKFD